MTCNDFDRQIKHGSEIVFSINKYTTPVTFAFNPEKKSTTLNVFESHKRVFITIKIVDDTKEPLINEGNVFNSLSKFPDELYYVNRLPAANKITKLTQIIRAV